MFIKANNKLLYLMAVWGALQLLSIPSFAENNSNDQLLFYAESFDYAQLGEWGFPALYDAEDDIVGLTSTQREDMSNHPEHWLRAWVRLYVQPCIREATTPLRDTEDDMDPLSYSHLRFENIRISNMHELGIYPKSYMVFAATPSAFLDESLQTDGDWWYMEIMIEKRDRTEDEITQALHQAIIRCDAYVQCNEQYKMRTDIAIDLSAVERRIFFENGSIEVKDMRWKRSDVSAGDIFANYNVSEDIELEAETYPEHFQCYALQFTLANHGPYDICSIDYWSVLSDNNAWLMYFDMEYCSIQGCKSGTSVPVNGYYLILRDPEYGGNISEETIDEMLIPIVIHTEFAGILRNDETEGIWGYDGVPFTIEIDMSSNCIIK